MYVFCNMRHSQRCNVKHRNSSPFHVSSASVRQAAGSRKDPPEAAGAAVDGAPAEALVVYAPWTPVPDAGREGVTGAGRRHECRPGDYNGVHCRYKKVCVFSASDKLMD